MLPDLSKLTGYLPVGIHDATWQEIADKFGDTPKRKSILDGLYDACLALRKANVNYLFLDGSFVSNKRNPGDWDGCYSEMGVDSLLLDPVFLDFTNQRAAQKAKYKGEAFIAEQFATSIGPPFIDYFQKEKNTGRKKGIVRLDLGTVI